MRSKAQAKPNARMTSLDLVQQTMANPTVSAISITKNSIGGQAIKHEPDDTVVHNMADVYASDLPQMDRVQVEKILLQQDQRMPAQPRVSAR